MHKGLKYTLIGASVFAFNPANLYVAFVDNGAYEIFLWMGLLGAYIGYKTYRYSVDPDDTPSYMLRGLHDIDSD